MKRLICRPGLTGLKDPLAHVAFMIILVLAVSSWFPAPLGAQPGMVHLSLESAGRLQAHSPVAVTWCSEAPGGNQYVKYGVFPDLENRIKAGRADFGKGYIYTSEFRKLKPGVRYFYRCGSDEAGWSPLYSFVTEPDTGSFRVGVFGDTQDNEGNRNFVRSVPIGGLIRLYSPTLILHMGDIVDNGSARGTWERHLEAMNELYASVPLMPALGNHDVNNSPGAGFQKPSDDFRKLFNLPGNETDYSYNYRNVHFVVLFSGCAEAAAKSGQVRYKPGSPEYRWLEKDLSGAEKNKKIKWIVVYMHYPLHSFGWSNVRQWKESVLPVIERHRVDLCLAGHRHVYERHFQLGHGVPVTKDPAAVVQAGRGTIFITNGTAGGNPTGLGGKDIPTMAYTQDRTIYSFAIMDISDKAISYRVFDKDNLLIDSFTIKQ